MCTVGLLLQGCAVSSTNEVVKPGERKSGFMGMSKTAEVVVDNAKTLKGHSNKVVIGSFKVGFLTDNKARAVAKGGVFSTSVSSGKASATVHLKGISPAEMQKATNDIYADFIKDLQNQGYTVMTPEELANQPAFTELQNAGVASPEEGVILNAAPDGKTTYVAPDGMKLVYMIGEKKAMFNISTETIKKLQALNEQTGVPVLAVNYVVNFVGAQSHGGFVSSASVKVGQGLAVQWGVATVYNGKNQMPATIKLGQAVYSEKEFCTIDKTTSTGAKAIGTAVNVASALLGGGTSQSETYDFNADPQAFVTAATEVGAKTNEKLIAKLAESK